MAPGSPLHRGSDIPHFSAKPLGGVAASDGSAFPAGVPGGARS